MDVGICLGEKQRNNIVIRSGDEPVIRAFFLAFVALTREMGLLIVRTDFVQRSFQVIRHLRRKIYLKRVKRTSTEGRVSSKENSELREEMKTGEEVEESAEAEQGVEEEKSLEVQLEEALAESADLKDKMLRIAADFENTKKRLEKERLAALKYAGENIFREILPALDNLERAIDQGVAEGVDPQKSLDGLLEGVQLTRKSLINSLEKFEVKPFNSVGEPFDPNQQEALSMAPSDEVPENHVITEYEKGYFYKDRLLRVAKVIVSSGKSD